MEDLKSEIQKNTVLKLDDFKSWDEVYLYVDAIVTSGSSEEAKGSVSVLGNTSVGKSSLVGTLRDYCKDTSKVPKPVLTGTDEHRDRLETRVLDLVDNVQLQQKRAHPKLTVKKGKVGIITVEDNPEKRPTQETEEKILENIKTSFVDFGGHNEYASCSPIFIKEKGVFLICFPLSRFKLHLAYKSEFFPSIGTYLQLVMENCEMPIIFLVATKAEQVNDPSISASLSDVMSTAREYLEEIAKKSKGRKPFIFDRVFQTSLDLTTQANLKSVLDDLMSNLVAVFGHRKLMDVQLRSVPKAWRKTVNFWKSNHQQITIEAAAAEYRAIIEKDQQWMGRAPEEQVIEDLEDWRIVAEKLINHPKESFSENDDAIDPDSDLASESSSDDESSLEEEEEEGSGPILQASLIAEHSGTVEPQRPDVVEKIGSGEVSKASKCMEGFLNCFLKRAPQDTTGQDFVEVRDEQPLQTFTDEGADEPSDLEKAEAGKDVDVVKGILTFFSSDNEILWFRSAD